MVLEAFLTTPNEHENKILGMVKKDVTFSRIVVFVRNPDLESFWHVRLN